MDFQNTSKSPEERAEDLLSRLTLREKVGQINQRLYGFACYEWKDGVLSLSQEFLREVAHWGGLGVLYGLYRADPWSKRDFTTGLSGKQMIEAYHLAQRTVIEHSRFGIPMLMSSECPHGHQALGGYLLPVNLGVGAAWNPGLTREAYALCGAQLKELGVDYALISMLDVLRDPRWGRSEECYGEDPFLAASLAEQAVRGCQSAGVEVVAKHFCAQGEGTGGVNASAARIGERELREIHLPPMAACCKAKVAGVMAAYNEIDGVYCHSNPHLLGTLLREEMGFSGVVMADGTAIDRLDSLTGSPAASGALALGAGVDISLWDRAFSHLEEAIEQGLVSEERLNQAVKRVLTVKFRRGLFEHPYLPEKAPKVYGYDRHPQSLELARQGAILLKNDGILPLEENKLGRLAVIGPNAHHLYHQLGDYTPPVREGAPEAERGGTLLEALRKRLPSVAYTPGCSVCGEGEAEAAAIAQGVALAQESDLVLLVLGGSSSRFAGASFDSNGAAIVTDGVQMDCGEGVDTATLTLPGWQEKLAQAILATGKPVITVVVAGRPYAIPALAEGSRALLYSFYPGPMGGRALTELLLGDCSPSGRLPASLPRHVGQLPCYYNPKASYAPMTYWNTENTPLYPFGYGMSYTSFAAHQIEFPTSITKEAVEAGEKAKLSFVMENTGKREAYCVPQLFLHRLQSSTVSRVKELKAFDKLLLKPGERRQCTLSLDREALSIWDTAMAFTPEKGEISLTLEEGGTVLGQGVLRII